MTAVSTSPRDDAWLGAPLSIVTLGAGAALSESTLCAMHHGAVATDRDPRRVVVPLPALQPAAGVECWQGGEAVTFGWHDDIGYATNGMVMLVQAHLPEAALASMEAAVYTLYRDLLALITDAGYPHLLRVWNYLSDINEGEGDAERYRRFCSGRYRALADTPGFETLLPAASAIGSPSGDGLRVFALATRVPGLQVENPQQVSAFRYPRIYGERSPSFSRATLAPWSQGAQLLVSGTASIVGHATVHAGDPLAQLQQAIDNLDAVRRHAMQRHLPTLAASDLAPTMALVYVRRPEDVPALTPLLRDHFGDAPVRILRGDICRRDLLVEIEAVYTRRTPAVEGAV